MALVPEGTRRFRLPSPHVQPSGDNGPTSRETFIPDAPPGPLPECFKIRSVKERSGLQATKQPVPSQPMQKKGPLEMPSQPTKRVLRYQFFLAGLAWSRWSDCRASVGGPLSTSTPVGHAATPFATAEPAARSSPPPPRSSQCLLSTPSSPPSASPLRLRHPPIPAVLPSPSLRRKMRVVVVEDKNPAGEEDKNPAEQV
jgi:hypothetical protein